MTRSLPGSRRRPPSDTVRLVALLDGVRVGDVLQLGERTLPSRAGSGARVGISDVVGPPHAAGGDARLAPFYDLSSSLPYAPRQLFRVTLAMRIGGEYGIQRIGRHWERLARDISVADGPHELPISRNARTEDPGRRRRVVYG